MWSVEEAHEGIGAAGGCGVVQGRLVEGTHSPDDFEAAAQADGVPSEFVDLLRSLFTTVLDGRNAHVTDGVQRALGREPRDFYDFAWDVARSGAWAAEVAR